MRTKRQKLDVAAKTAEIDTMISQTAAKPVRKAAKQAKAKSAGKPSRKPKTPSTPRRKPAAAPAENGAGPGSKVREMIWSLMQQKDGCTERDVCAALGWKKAGATISRAVRAAPFKIVKERVDGRMRYIAQPQG